MRIVRIVTLFLSHTLMIALPSYGAQPNGAQQIHLPPVAGFIPNQGQAPAEVLYYGSCPGGAVYLTRDAIIVDTWKSERVGPESARHPLDQSVRRQGSAVWLTFRASNPGVEIAADDRKASQFNYFIGSDPASWHAAVPAFGRAVYRDLWPGVDLVITAAPGGFECRLDTKPDAATDAAAFELRTGDGARPTPVILDGIARLLSGDGDAGSRNPGSAAMQPASDPSTLRWSSYLGGTAEELGWGTTVDSQGNPVTIGVAFSTFFPTTPGAYDVIYSGLGEVFISKLSANGASLLWSTFLGGTSIEPDYGFAVALDANDNPVVTGHTRSEDFPVTPGSWDINYHGFADVFVTKLNAAGSAILWSTFIGGLDHDIGYALDIDTDNSPVVVGRSASLDFPATADAYDNFPNGEEDGFVARLTPSGNNLTWCSMLGGSTYDGIESIELDPVGAPVVCGYTGSFDFPAGAANGLYDVFVARFSPSGSFLNWARLLGGSSYDYGTGIALDSMGNLVISGATGSPDFPVTPGAYDQTYNGDDDAFAAKFEGEDGNLLWATFLGGTTPVYEIAQAVVMDAANRPLLAGTTPSPDFPTTGSGYDTSHNGAGDVFLLRLNGAGTTLEWSSFFGGSEEDYAFGLAKSADGTVVMTGWVGRGFPATQGSYDLSYNGDLSDVFVARVSPGLATGVAAGTGGTGAGSMTATAIGLGIAPNPVTAGASISFTLPAAASTRIELFDMQGRRRASLDRGVLAPGAHSLDWNALAASSREDLPAGVYVIRVTAGDLVQSRRSVLVR